jgi:DNA polymerase zeta
MLGELAVNPGLAAIWEDEKQRRREGGRTSQITPQSSQERPFAASTDSAVFFKQKLQEKLLLLNSQVWYKMYTTLPSDF